MPLKKVIFVDDEPRILSAISRRLSDDFELYTFERGAEAIAFLEDHDDISVLVADMRMPEMNGIELLKKTMEIRPDIKRIMLTGNTDLNTAVDAINEGNVYRFLKKPCDADRIRAAVMEAIEDQSFDKAELEKIADDIKTTESKANQDLFLSVMSDELRTPLSQIISTANLLSSKETEMSEMRKARFLRQVTESGENALGKIDRILNFVRLQSKRPEGRVLENVDLRNLIDSEMKKFGEEAAGLNCLLSQDIQHGTVKFKADEECIRLAFREILSNSIRHNLPEGFVRVQCKWSEAHAAIRITNTGPEFPPKDLSNDVDVFDVRNAELNRNKSGMGLGLSLAQIAARSGKFDLEILPRKGGGVRATLVFERNSKT